MVECDRHVSLVVRRRDVLGRAVGVKQGATADMASADEGDGDCN